MAFGNKRARDMPIKWIVRSLEKRMWNGKQAWNNRCEMGHIAWSRGWVLSLREERRENEIRGNMGVGSWSWSESWSISFTLSRSVLLGTGVLDSTAMNGQTFKELLSCSVENEGIVEHCCCFNVVIGMVIWRRYSSPTRPTGEGKYTDTDIDTVWIIG